MMEDASMSIISPLKGGYRIARERGIRDAYHKGKAFIRESSLRSWHKLSGRADRGEPIYGKEWDLLVILDACRFDALQNATSNYHFLNEMDSIESLGSYSQSWMERNFTEEYDEEIARTTMVSGNPYTESVLDAERFARLEEVWRYSWDEDIGTIRPRPLTDTAISLARRENPERMIVHYMQPHAPFTTHPELQSGRSASNWADLTDKSVWMRVREGELSLARAREAYHDELEMVLQDIALLLSSVDAETAVISADHGEAMGERGVYGHPRGVAIDALRIVPWVETTATDDGTHEPDLAIDTTGTSGDQKDRLRDLGYLK